MTDRATREALYHDHRYSAPSVRAKTRRFYSIAQTVQTHYHSEILAFANQQGSVLEYGCGTGSSAFALADAGARVTGIDISYVAIQNAIARSGESLSSSPHFMVMNAEHLGFESCEFDLVCGMGILHHLDLVKSLSEIARVLKPSGKAVFIEPLGLNPFINLYRRLTPEMRTLDEHPLLPSDIERLRQSFRKVEVRYYYLTTLASAIWVDRAGFHQLRRSLEAVDAFLFRLPALRIRAWQALIRLSDPCPMQL